MMRLLLVSRAAYVCKLSPGVETPNLETPNLGTIMLGSLP